MHIIEITPQPNGAHRNQMGAKVVPDGWAVIPDGMSLPDSFPFCSIEAQDGVVTAIAPVVVPDSTPATPPPAELRRQAYSMGVADGADWRVEWQGDSYTTDELTLLGMQYRYRGEDETADAICTVVQAGVEAIRTAYPDEDTGVLDCMSSGSTGGTVFGAATSRSLL